MLSGSSYIKQKSPLALYRVSHVLLCVKQFENGLRTVVNGAAGLDLTWFMLKNSFTLQLLLVLYRVFQRFCRFKRGENCFRTDERDGRPLCSEA
jgi:uncharacterized membrane protein